MQKLIVFNHVSLDGYFVDAKNGMSWAKSEANDAEWNAFVAENAEGDATLVFGRVTYEMMASYWPTPMADADEVGRWMLTKRAQLDEPDRLRIIRAMSPGASDADACWLPQFIYTSMVSPDSPADLRVARAIMFGREP